MLLSLCSVSLPHGVMDWFVVCVVVCLCAISIIVVLLKGRDGCVT